MIERMARAMVVASGGNPDSAVRGSAGVSTEGFVYVVDFRREWEDKIDLARAVLTSMLDEPSDAMTDAAFNTIGRNKGPASHYDCKRAFAAMVRAALDEKDG